METRFVARHVVLKLLLTRLALVLNLIGYACGDVRVYDLRAGCERWHSNTIHGVTSLHTSCPANMGLRLLACGTEGRVSLLEDVGGEGGELTRVAALAERWTDYATVWAGQWQPGSNGGSIAMAVGGDGCARLLCRSEDSLLVSYFLTLAWLWLHCRSCLVLLTAKKPFVLVDRR